MIFVLYIVITTFISMAQSKSQLKKLLIKEIMNEYDVTLNLFDVIDDLVDQVIADASSFDGAKSEMFAWLRDGIWENYFPKIYNNMPNNMNAKSLKPWLKTLGLTPKDFGDFWTF